VVVALAAVVLGCGGGGGGGGGSNGSSATTATTANPTTTATTVTTATNGTSAGTDGNAGNLPANRVFYVEDDPTGTTYDVKFIAEDGSGAGTYQAGFPLDSTANSPDPSAPGQIVFAAQPAGSTKLGIYRNTSTSTSGATTIVAPSYGEIISLQVARDGSKVVYVAANTLGGDPGVYVVSTNPGATPVRLDDALDASLSSAGDRVVYNKYPASGGLPDIYVFVLGEGAPHRITNDSPDEAEPQFSKDGSQIVFSQSVSGSDRYRLVKVNLQTGATAVLDPLPTASLRGPSFNSDATRVSFVGQSPTDDSVNGIYTASATDGTGLSKLVTSVRLMPVTYWTTPLGRGPGGIPFGLNLPRRKH
jgi:hypothetical protein